MNIDSELAGVRGTHFTDRSHIIRTSMNMELGTSSKNGNWRILHGKAFGPGEKRIIHPKNFREATWGALHVLRINLNDPRNNYGGSLPQRRAHFRPFILFRNVKCADQMMKLQLRFSSPMESKDRW